MSVACIVYHTCHSHPFYSAGKPIASARCTIRTGLPRFEEPQILDCGQTLTDIQRNVRINMKMQKKMSIKNNFFLGKTVTTTQAGQK